MCIVCYHWSPQYNSVGINKQAGNTPLHTVWEKSTENGWLFEENHSTSVVFKWIQWLFSSVYLVQDTLIFFFNVSLEVHKIDNPNSDYQKWGSFVSFAVGVIMESEVQQMFL